MFENLFGGKIFQYFSRVKVKLSVEFKLYESVHSDFAGLRAIFNPISAGVLENQDTLGGGSI